MHQSSRGILHLSHTCRRLFDCSVSIPTSTTALRITEPLITRDLDSYILALSRSPIYLMPNECASGAWHAGLFLATHDAGSEKLNECPKMPYLTHGHHNQARLQTSLSPSSSLFLSQRLCFGRQAGLCRLSFVHLQQVARLCFPLLLSALCSYFALSWILFAGKNTILALQYCTYLKIHTTPLIKRKSCSQQAFLISWPPAYYLSEPHQSLR